VANYGINIDVKVKAQQLQKFNKEISATQLKVTAANRSIHNFAKTFSGIAVPSIQNFEKTLARANKAFREAAIGTPQATRATKDYLKALTLSNEALAKQKAAVVSLQNARQSDAFFLAQGARAGRQNRLDETQSQAISAAIARENNIRIQAELKNQELLKEVQTRAPRLPAFQERGLERLEDEFKKKKELTTLEENANKSSKRRLNFQEKQNQELERQRKLGIGVNKNEKLINASFEDRVKFAEKNGKIRRQALIRANNLVLAEKKITEQRAKQNQTTAAGGSRRRIGSTASSAIIGGAFPLLFGQTGAAAVGGGLGGLAGGAIGGQFGFALSILGTAIGSAIDKSDKFNLSVAKLNGQLKTLGFDSQFTGNEINKLANSLKITKEEALQVVGAFSRFGKERGELLAQTIGQDTGGLFAIANVRNQATALQAIEAISKNITFEKQAELIASLKNNTATQIQLKLQEILLEAKFEEQKTLIEEIGLRERIFDIVKKTVLKLSEGSPDMAESPEERVARELKELEERFDKLRLIFDGVIGSIQSVQTETNNLQFSTTGAIENIEKDLKKLQDPMFQLIEISGAIGNSFAESFKGIVKGTMTAQDALRNLFSRTADAFLDMAAQMIAKQIQMKILGIGLNFFMGGGLASSRGATTGGTDRFGRDFDDPMFGLPPNRAEGGPVKRGGSFIVGERGPELFTPGVSGMITPNHALGGSTNVVVNVDASGSSVEGDEQQGRELGRLISVAVQSEIANQQRPGGLLFR